MPCHPAMTTAPSTSSDTGHRIFIVDDHPLVRECLASLIHNQPDLRVCGEAETAAEALAGIISAQPDVAVVDLSLKGELALQLIKDLQALQPAPAVVVLSMHDEAFYAERALRNGARGYVTKREATSKVIEAIRAVMIGRLFISPSLATQLAEKLVGGGEFSTASPIAGLSDRELEVFDLLGQGWESRRIAAKLQIGAKTVQSYCERIKEKLGLENSAALRRAAVRWVEVERER